MRRLLPWVPVAAALGLFLAPLDPALVERWYSGSFYLQLQPRLTALSSLVPFAAFDIILVATVAIVVWILAAAVRGVRRKPRGPALATAIARLLVTGACLYLWFVAAW